MKPALPGEEELAETTLRSTMPMRNFFLAATKLRLSQRKL
jgi:hypothetical protein